MALFKVVLVGLPRDNTDPATVARLLRAVGILVRLLQKQRDIAGVGYLASVSKACNPAFADALAHLGDFYVMPPGLANFALALPGWDDSPATCEEVKVMNLRGVPVFADLPSLIMAISGYRPSLANVAHVRTADDVCELRSFSRDIVDPILQDLFRK